MHVRGASGFPVDGRPSPHFKTSNEYFTSDWSKVKQSFVIFAVSIALAFDDNDDVDR
jgi:hypothetical protein